MISYLKTLLKNVFFFSIAPKLSSRLLTWAQSNTWAVILLPLELVQLVYQTSKMSIVCSYFYSLCWCLFSRNAQSIKCPPLTSPQGILINVQYFLDFVVYWELWIAARVLCKLNNHFTTLPLCLLSISWLFYCISTAAGCLPCLDLQNPRNDSVFQHHLSKHAEL